MLFDKNSQEKPLFDVVILPQDKQESCGQYVQNLRLKLHNFN